MMRCAPIPMVMLVRSRGKESGLLRKPLTTLQVNIRIFTQFIIFEIFFQATVLQTGWNLRVDATSFLAAVSSLVATMSAWIGQMLTRPARITPSQGKFYINIINDITYFIFQNAQWRACINPLKSAASISNSWGCQVCWWGDCSVYLLFPLLFTMNSLYHFKGWSFWIGLTSILTWETFAWSDESDVDFANWNGDEPNGYVRYLS